MHKHILSLFCSLAPGFEMPCLAVRMEASLDAPPIGIFGPEVLPWKPHSKMQEKRLDMLRGFNILYEPGLHATQK